MTLKLPITGHHSTSQSVCPAELVSSRNHGLGIQYWNTVLMAKKDVICSTLAETILSNYNLAQWVTNLYSYQTLKWKRYNSLESHQILLYVGDCGQWTPKNWTFSETKLSYLWDAVHPEKNIAQTNMTYCYITGENPISWFGAMINRNQRKSMKSPENHQNHEIKVRNHLFIVYLIQ